MDFSEKFWKKTYQENIGKMIGICFRYVQNRQIAEDLAQDAFIMAMEKSSSYKRKGSFEAWLRKIVVNTALQYLRKQKVKEETEHQLKYEFRVQELQDDYRETSLIARAEFSHDELLATINHIPEHHRLVFNMYVLDQYSHVQIGEELGISPGTSKSHLSRARKRIQELLYQKALEKQDEKKKWKALIFFILPFRVNNIDRLYKRKFDAFELTPGKGFKFSKVSTSNLTVPVIRTGISGLKYIIVSVISLGILSSVLLIRGSKQSNQQVVPETDSVYSTPEVVNKTDTTVTGSGIVADEKKDTEEVKTPVIIREKIIKHKQVVIRDTVEIIKSDNAK